MQNNLNEKEFVISRTFNAPKELIFRAFTEAEHLKHWWGPTGFKMGTVKVDLRPGGMFHYSMVAANGVEMWGRFIYREVSPFDRLVFVNSFSDEAGNITTHPMAPDWPQEMLNNVTFEEADGKTTVTLRGRPINATETQTKVYHDNHPSMQQGFGGTFDQLDEYLETLNATTPELA